MKNMKFLYLWILSLLVVFSSCSNQSDSESNSQKDESIKEFEIAKSEPDQPFRFPNVKEKLPGTNRWYTQNQVNNGEQIFANICASCHKKDASGAENWRQAVNGKYPAPPLDGSAHAWHHPIKQLHKTIKEGTMSMGGSMPAWGGALTDEQILESIAYFQSKWSDEIYQTWVR